MKYAITGHTSGIGKAISVASTIGVKVAEGTKDVTSP